jgi:CRISPR-associated protein (TIGR03984 family)
MRCIKQISTNVILEKWDKNNLVSHFSDNSDYFIIIWNKSSLIIDIFDNKYIDYIENSINDNQLIESRIFSQLEEIKIFNRMNQWNILIVKDNEGEQKEYFDAEQIISGKEIINQSDIFYLVQMGQKTPAQKTLGEKLELNQNHKLDKPLRLVTRNYIAPNEIGQYGITLTRMVKIGF